MPSSQRPRHLAHAQCSGKPLMTSVNGRKQKALNVGVRPQPRASSGSLAASSPRQTGVGSSGVSADA